MSDSNSAPIRVLHVEDERGAIEITKLYLKRKSYNFKITPVLSAEKALEILERENFDIVISDYKMPRMNGLEFLEELRNKGNDIPFIIFTGKGEERVAMDAVNKGASRYIKKEGNPNVLFDTLGQYIREVVEEKERAEEKERRLKELEEMSMKLQGASKALERHDKKTSVDISPFLNEQLDLIILGILVDKPKAASDVQEEIHGRFGVWVSSDRFRESLAKLEEKEIIEWEFSKEQKLPVFRLKEGIDDLFQRQTFSREMLTSFLELAERVKVVSAQ